MRIRTRCITAIATMATIGLPVAAEELDLAWCTIDGGGGRSTSPDGSIELTGSIGQPDAGALGAGSFELYGGFQQHLPLQNCVEPGFLPGEPGASVSIGMHDGYIDPRRESNNGVDHNQGLASVTMRFATPIENTDGSPLSMDRFAITDSADDPPSITGIATPDGQSVTIYFDAPITAGTWTTVSVSSVRSVCGHAPFDGQIDLGFLPGDVNQSGSVNPLDLIRFKQYVNGLAQPTVGLLIDYVDINRSGGVNPLDLVAFKQLVNGLPPATESWQGKVLPVQP